MGLPADPAPPVPVTEDAPTCWRCVWIPVARADGPGYRFRLKYTDAACDVHGAGQRAEGTDLANLTDV